jgi:heme/copper-type cytochrome/quinol oxidase subunit 2
MSLINCDDCGQEISDQAEMCIKCGKPYNTKESHAPLQGSVDGASPWSAVTKAKTPINIFAIAMMTCASVLGVSATHINSELSLTAFTYTLHIFLSVTGMFFVTILFCRKGVYHPDDLASAKRAGVTDLGEDRPVIAAVLIFVMLFAYGLFQAVKGEYIKITF